jgi:2-polyprenyl-3-methyl-5-hydroxy-6-metoxy-1,4-benzoquinol methylase
MAKCGFRVTAIDEISSYWQGEFFNRHHYVIHDDITNPKLDRTFDAITCISVVEHIPDHLAAIRGLFKLLNPGGHLILTFPYNEERYVDNVYALLEAGYGKGASYVCQVFSREEINSWLRECPGTIIEQEYYQIFSGDLWTFGERVCPIRKVSSSELHHLTCIHIRRS